MAADARTDNTLPLAGVFGLPIPAICYDPGMSLRMPTSLTGRSPLQSGVEMLETELMVEKGSALGRAGRAVEEALAALVAIDSGEAQGDRAAQVDFAAGLVWELLVMQEACGVRNARMTYREYNLPREVVLRVGATPPKAGPNAAGVSFVNFMR